MRKTSTKPLTIDEKRIYANMQTAFQKSFQYVPNEIKLYRGISDNIDYCNQFKVNDIYTLHGYTSTSIDINIGNKFSNPKGCFFEIIIPQHSFLSFIPLYLISDKDNYNEKEVLLNHLTKIQIIKIDNKNIYAQILPSKISTELHNYISNFNWKKSKSKSKSKSKYKKLFDISKS